MAGVWKNGWKNAFAEFLVFLFMRKSVRLATTERKSITLSRKRAESVGKQPLCRVLYIHDWSYIDNSNNALGFGVHGYPNQEMIIYNQSLNNVKFQERLKSWGCM